MTKQEFIDFCHEEFTKRGFKKKGKTYYYLKGKDLLCGIYLQKSMAEAFYVNFYYCFGEYSDVKKYPKIYDSDISERVVVWSKDTFKGKHFWDAMIDYEKYTVEEIKPYFDRDFDEHIMPPIAEGKAYILENLDYYFRAVFDENKEKIIKKLTDNNMGASAEDVSSS